MAELHRKPKAPDLNYPFAAPPSTGKALEVAPGVLWMRMPMSGALSHINVWAIEDGDGWAVVDTGMRTPETTNAWIRLLGEALGGRPVTRVFVTHMHPDHIGLAGWMTRRFGCRLWITRLEYLSCSALSNYTEREPPQDGVDFYRRCGWDEASIETYRARFGTFGRMIYAMPDSHRRLHDGERLAIGARQWQVVVGNGHSPEHACLYCPELKLLISGDQVLPKISSNVSVHPNEPDADPVSEWLASLAKLARLVPDDVLVLPAHNEPFRGLHDRLAYLAVEQKGALERLKEALAQPKRVIDLFEAVFFARSYSDHMQLQLATGETLACLNHLMARSEAIAQADGGGVLWYRAS